MPGDEQADAQAQTDGESPRKIANFLAAVRKLEELIRGAVALNVVRNPLPCASCRRSPRASPANRVTVIPVLVANRKV
jgi:hypothetical protein